MSPDLGHIRECFQKALKLSDEEREQVNAETSVWNFRKWNSLGHVALLLELERAFGVKFDESRTAEIVSVEEIIRTIGALMHV